MKKPSGSTLDKKNPYIAWEIPPEICCEIGIKPEAECN